MQTRATSVIWNVLIQPLSAQREIFKWNRTNFTFAAIQSNPRISSYFPTISSTLFHTIFITIANVLTKNAWHSSALIHLRSNAFVMSKLNGEKNYVIVVFLGVQGPSTVKLLMRAESQTVCLENFQTNLSN